MKEVLFFILAAVIALSAAEWDIEQITDASDLWSSDPLLALDAQGQPHILFTQWDGNIQIKVAVRDTESWFIRDVATVSEEFLPYYSIDVDGDGATYVAYADWMSIDNADIFIATDKEGSFESVNVSHDGLSQLAPVLRVDRGGIPRILYAEAVVLDESINLYYGWIFEGELHGELVADNMYQFDYVGYDLVLDQGSITTPHAFYIGNNGYLWHAAPGELVWTRESINELSSTWPSAVADPLGSFHVAYDVGGSSIHYISNMSGTWQDEMISDVGTPEGGNERPVLALETVYGGSLGIGYPHVVWMHADGDWWYDFYYSSRTTEPWEEEPVTATPEYDELPGYGRYFALDIYGYGHFVYCAEDSHYVTQLFYAKSEEPLIKVAVAENPPGSVPLGLEVEGDRVRFSLPQSSFVRLDLYDASGRMVKELASGSYPAGQCEVAVDLRNLPSGVYFARLESGNSSAKAKMVLFK